MSRHHNKTVQVELTPDEADLLEQTRHISGLPQAEIFRRLLIFAGDWSQSDWRGNTEPTRIPGGRR